MWGMYVGLLAQETASSNGGRKVEECELHVAPRRQKPPPQGTRPAPLPVTAAPQGLPGAAQCPGCGVPDVATPLLAAPAADVGREGGGEARGGGGPCGLAGGPWQRRQLLLLARSQPEGHVVPSSQCLWEEEEEREEEDAENELAAKKRMVWTRPRRWFRRSLLRQSSYSSFWLISFSVISIADGVVDLRGEVGYVRVVFGALYVVSLWA